MILFVPLHSLCRDRARGLPRAKKGQALRVWKRTRGGFCSGRVFAKSKTLVGPVGVSMGGPRAGPLRGGQETEVASTVRWTFLSGGCVGGASRASRRTPKPISEPGVAREAAGPGSEGSGWDALIKGVPRGRLGQARSPPAALHTPLARGCSHWGVQLGGAEGGPPRVLGVLVHPQKIPQPGCE